MDNPARLTALFVFRVKRWHPQKKQQEEGGWGSRFLCRGHCGKLASLGERGWALQYILSPPGVTVSPQNLWILPIWSPTGTLGHHYLDQMYDGILKEDHVHAGSTNALVVVAQEGVKALPQTLKRLHRLVHLGRVRVGLFRLFPCEKRDQTVTIRYLAITMTSFHSNVGRSAPAVSGASRRKSTKYLSVPRSTMALCSAPICSPTSVARAWSNHSTSSGLVNRSAMTRLHSCFHSASSS